MTQGAKVQHTIPLRNGGTVDLIVETMSLSLPALTVRAPRVVPPGREANLTLELNTAELSGEVHGDVVLHGDAIHLLRLGNVLADRPHGETLRFTRRDHRVAQ